MKAKQKLNEEGLDDYYTWVKAIWVNARGESLDFNEHKYLVDIYSDQFPNIVFQKAAQMGISERLVSEAVWICDRLSKNTLYIFPTSSQLNDFAQARLEPVFNQSDYLSRITGIIPAEQRRRQNIDEGDKIKKVGLKQIRDAFLYLRGSQNQKQIISVDADAVILDERDRFIQEHVPYIDKRTLHSTLRWRREASTPTYPGMGISEAYENSDQRVWMLECDECGLEQELDFFFNVDFDKKTTICKQCHHEINRLKKGKWVPLNPDNKDVHGYKLNGIYNPRRTVDDLIDTYEKSKLKGFSEMQQFYNQVLGLPFEAEGQKILVSDLNGLRKDYEIPVKDAIRCFGGADVGQVINVIVSQPIGKDLYKYVYIGTVKDFTGPTDSLEYLINRFKIMLLVVDSKPDTRQVEILMKMFPGRVYAADYPNRKFDIQEYYVYDDIKSEVYIDRTISLDYLVSDIQNARIELPRNAAYIPEFYEQMTSAIRITEINPKTGQPTPRWVPRGPDHYMHAANYNRVANLKGMVGQALLDLYNDNTNKKERSPLPDNIWDLARWVKIKGQRIF